MSLTHADRDSSHTPLFQVMFALQNVPPPELHAPELVLTPLELSSSTSNFDLTLFATEVPEGLRLNFEYNADLFDAATAERMLAHFQILLEEIIAAPDQSIGAIPMLTPHERTQVLQGFNPLAPGDDEDEFDDLGDDDLGDDDLESKMYEFSSTELATND